MIDPKLVDGVAATGEEEDLTKAPSEAVQPTKQEDVPTVPELDLSGVGFEDELDLLADDGLAPNESLLASEQPVRPSPRREVLIGASGIYNVALGRQDITGDYVDQLLAQGRYGYQDYGNLLPELRSAIFGRDPEVEQAAARNIILDPNMTPEQKVEAIGLLPQTGQDDVNGVQRAATERAAIAEYAAEDDDDDAERLASNLNAVQNIPDDTAPVDGDVDEVYAEINEIYKQSKGAKWGDIYDLAEQMTPVGSLPTLNATVKRVYEYLGPDFADSNYARVMSYGQVGSAMKELRQAYRDGDPATKRRIASAVLRAVKEDTSIIGDSNTFVVVQVIEQVLPGVIGEDIYAESDVNTEEAAALDAQIAAARKAGDQVKVQQLLAQRYPVQPMKMLDNVFNILDWVGVGGVGRQGLSAGNKYVPRLWDWMFGAAPKTGARRGADAIQNPEVAAQMGMTPEDAAHAGLPNSGAVVERGMASIAEIAKRDREVNDALARISVPVNMTDAERASAFQDILDDVNLYASKPLPKQQLHSSSITPRDDKRGVDIVGVFGKNEYHGYATLEAAQKATGNAVEQMFGKGAPVEIVQYNPITRGFDPVPAGTNPKAVGDFYLRVQDTRLYSSTKNTWGALSLGDDSVANLTLGAAVSRWTRGINVFNPQFQDWISSRAREGYAMEAMAAGYMKPILALPEEQKLLLSNIIKAEEGRVLNSTELAAKGLSDDGIAAYHSFRALDDTMYNLLDGFLRVEKQRAGLQDIYHNNQRVGFGKPIQSPDLLDNARVFDPSDGSYHSYTKADLQRLYGEGGSIARLEYPIRGGKGNADYVLLGDRATKVLPVPMKGILPRIPGHYPHIQQGNFVVYGFAKNGERRALALAADETTARAYAARREARAANRQAKSKSVGFTRYAVERDMTLAVPERYAARLDEMMQGRQGLLFGQRSGGKLRNLNPEVADTELDPIAGLLQGWQSASYHVGKGELIANLRQRVANYVNSIPGLGKYKDIPADKIDVSMIAETANGRARDKALAMLKQIELMEGVPDAYRAATRAIYQRLATGMHRITQLVYKPTIGVAGKAKGKPEAGLASILRASERGLLSASKGASNPLSGITSLAHQVYIAMGFSRQWVLNTIQLTVAAGLHPLQTGKMVRQMAPFTAAVFQRAAFLHGDPTSLLKSTTLDNEGLRALAQMTKHLHGLDVDEFVKLVDTVVERGIIDATAHNTLVRDSVGRFTQKAMTQQASTLSRRAGALQRAGEAVGRVVGLPGRIGTQIGFQLGENMNQLGSLLLRYNADKAAGKANLNSQKYVDDLVGSVAEITGNMIPDASFAYTRNWLKLATQWLQFNHKMLLLTLPKKLGGSTKLSGVEKARIGISQFLLFGTEATVISSVAHNVMESALIEKMEEAGVQDNALVEWWRGAEAKAWFDGLVFDYTANRVMQAIYGEPDEQWRDFAWSKAVAPGSGHEMINERIIGIFALDPEAIMGTQLSLASNLLDYGRTVGNVALAQWSGEDKVPFEKRAEQLMKRGASILFPTYGKWLAAKWALEHDANIGRGGQLMEGFRNEMEAVLSVHFGINTKDRESYYAAMQQLGSKTRAEEKAEVDAITAKYWESLVANATKFASENQDSDMYTAMVNEWTADQALLFSMLDREDRERMNEVIAQKLQDVASGNGSPAETEFVRKLAQKLQNGGFGSEGPKIANYLRNLDFVKNNPERAYLVEQAWDEMMQDKADNGELPSTMETVE